MAEPRDWREAHNAEPANPGRPVDHGDADQGDGDPGDALIAPPTSSPGAPLAGPMPANQHLRWIPPIRLGGRWQMAIDTWLLDQTGPGAQGARASNPVLRVYRWSRPTLSLGRHQRLLEPQWWRLAAAGRLDLVRRPSGGRAVLHGFDLTYALIWPNPPRRRRMAYAQTCGWLQACFAKIGRPIHPGSDSLHTQPASCFRSATAADLIHADGGKRIGSAQFWRHGALLQHGSIQLDPPADLWREVFEEDPPALEPLPLALEELIDLLRREALNSLPMAAGLELQQRELSSVELAEIAGQLPTYDLFGRAGDATSPVFTMDRAT